jgi:tetratricopeptide (TPR) repeat protein
LLAKPEAALADLTEAINAQALSPGEQARAFLERGLVLDGMNRLNDAIGDYGAVLRLTPNSPAALNNRANAFRRQNRFDEARRDYLASLAADNPAPEYPYFGLGQIAESEGKSGEARNFYAKAIAANPGYSLAAQRLTALGGSPAKADIITLKPPKGMGTPKIAAAENAAMTPRPPAAKPAPQFKVAAEPRMNPAAYSDRDSQPGLRPALDNPGGQQVQLGAWRQEAEAAAGWDRASKMADGALSGFSPLIVAADLPGKGRYYRLRVVTPDGKRLCAILIAKGLACILARD